MQPILLVCLSLALCAAPLCAAAQDPEDIVIANPQTLEFELNISISPGTEVVNCYQEDQLRPVGSVSIDSGETARVPVALPDPVIRCTACNTFGCSSLSPNAAILVRPASSESLDFNDNGEIEVGDMIECVAMIRDAIFQ